jgi:hypothetical protein
MTSGSRLQLPEGSNFATAGAGAPRLNTEQNPRRPGSPDVTFSQVQPIGGGSLNSSTASVRLMARDDSVSGKNSFSVRLEGRSDKGQRLELGLVRVRINPSKN